MCPLYNIGSLTNNNIILQYTTACTCSKQRTDFVFHGCTLSGWFYYNHSPVEEGEEWINRYKYIRWLMIDKNDGAANVQDAVGVTSWWSVVARKQYYAEITKDHRHLRS